MCGEFENLYADQDRRYKEQDVRRNKQLPGRSFRVTTEAHEQCRERRKHARDQIEM
jgi:hypothetical protein